MTAASNGYSHLSIKDKLRDLGLNLKVVATGLQNAVAATTTTTSLAPLLQTNRVSEGVSCGIWVQFERCNCQFANSVAAAVAAASSPLPSSIAILSSNCPFPDAPNRTATNKRAKKRKSKAQSVKATQKKAPNAA